MDGQMRLTAVGDVNRCTKGVADSELHDAGNELSSSAHEESSSKDDLVRADVTQRVGVRKTRYYSLASHSIGRFKATQARHGPRGTTGGI